MKAADDATNKSQLDLIMEYFKKNPYRDIKHPEIVDWLVAEYKKRTGKVFRDPNRRIRRLHRMVYSSKFTRAFTDTNQIL